MNQPSSKMNTFDEYFARVDESRHQAKTVSNKLVESILKIGVARKTNYTVQRAIDDNELEIDKIKSANAETRRTLLKALVERDEYLTKKTALMANNHRLEDQSLALQNELDDLLRGDEVDDICEKFAFSEQNSVLKDIQDARYKLMKLGFPSSHFI